MGSATDRFEEYVSLMAQQLGHADRVEPFRGYCTGLLLPVQRKSVEPMAAHLAPERVRSEHQRLHHFVADAAWSDDAVLAAVRGYVLERVVRRAGAPEALLIDDTGFPKQGSHSVGVARQYCGQLGKQDNCQVAVSVSLANEAYSLPVAYRLYLPQSWAEDAPRRQQGKVPATVKFATKPVLALHLLEQLRGVAQLPDLVVADAGYGVDTKFRERLGALGFKYVVGITGAVSVWPQGQGPLPPKPWSGRGRKTKLLRRDAQHQPLQAKALALQLPHQRFRTLTWREGTNQALSSRFAALRVRCAHRDYWRAERHPEQWLLIEWPQGEAEPTKYFLSTLPLDTPLKELVRLAKLRWRIERDYQELKQELGLGHFEGRSWRGFHHHATLCIAAYAFLLTQRIAAPKKTLPHPILGEVPALPDGFRPRGSPAQAAPRDRLDRHATSGTRRRADRRTRPMPVLRSAD
ncbi:MAG: IS701 family transposase [Pseudomonadota bacterium]|nr:IS701 family transposase [Pseudomonadota bacterium]